MEGFLVSKRIDSLNKTAYLCYKLFEETGKICYYGGYVSAREEIQKIKEGNQPQM